MKIDPTIQFPSDPQSDRVTSGTGKAAQSQGSSSASGVSSPNAEDTFSLSSTHGEIQALTANLVNVPEVRTSRVSALQQRVSTGSYQPDSQKVADAIILDQAGRKH
ncbi:MAG TPA: flagellar biosynthesis anti-sigma factor FlgM [Candidatus Solibacter sp.]|nr:flagellar biosynthesis anti-sigma factor FlgM [Candidatus Solibacter sp.]